MPLLTPNLSPATRESSSTNDPDSVSNDRLALFNKFERMPSDEWLCWPTAIAALRNAQSLRTGWDSYDAEPPSAIAIARMWILIESIRDRDLPGPYRVMASSEGGMALVFSRGPRLAQIEFLNSGSAFITTLSDTDIPSVAGFALEQLDPQLQTIQNFLRK